MNTPKKLRAKAVGVTPSELTKLKAKWRELSEDARAFWSELFVSDTSQADIRSQLLKKLQINLRFDKQLNAFRAWTEDQAILDLEAERQEEDERRALEENPEWSLDQARESVLKKAYQRATATGNFKLGLAVVKQDLNAKVVMLDRDKFQFDAAKAALAKSKELKTISTSKLSDAEKIDAARQALFGELPVEGKA